MPMDKETDRTLEERSTYGNYETNAALSQSLKQVMRVHNRFAYLPKDMKESLELIQLKISRIINGDYEYVDNWHDIQGYARLIEKRLIKETEK